jgi:hypothetical protein
MDCWHPISVRAEKPDVAQRWAELEAKSPLMRDELLQRFAPRKPERRRPFSNAAMLCEFFAVALKAWWHIRGS